MTAIGLQSSFTLLSLSFCVLCSSDVETVRSLVEEIETDNTDEITDNSDQQGIGKRVIGEERRRINAPVHSLVIFTRCATKCDLPWYDIFIISLRW